MSKYNRRGGAPVTMGYVQGVRENYPPQYLHPKYLVFIERALNLNLEVILYMPQDSVSKYVTVRRKGKRFKVRFSNHVPIKYLEAQKSCDFFVGVTNFGVTNTDQAWTAMLKHFKIKEHTNESDKQ